MWCPLLNAIKHINNIIIEIIEVVEISSNVFLTYELLSILFVNASLKEMIFLYRSLALQRECELVTSIADLATFLEVTSVT